MVGHPPPVRRELPAGVRRRSSSATRTACGRPPSAAPRGHTCPFADRRCDTARNRPSRDQSCGVLSCADSSSNSSPPGRFEASGRDRDGPCAVRVGTRGGCRPATRRENWSRLASNVSTRRARRVHEPDVAGCPAPCGAPPRGGHRATDAAWLSPFVSGAPNVPRVFPDRSNQTS